MKYKASRVEYKREIEQFMLGKYVFELSSLEEPLSTTLNIPHSRKKHRCHFWQRMV